MQKHHPQPPPSSPSPVTPHATTLPSDSSRAGTRARAYTALHTLIILALCLASYYLGRRRPPSITPIAPPRPDHIVAEVLWATPLARTHIATYLPPLTNLTAFNAALFSAAVSDHTAFSLSSNLSSRALNDAFYAHQIARAPTAPHLRLKTLPEFATVQHMVRGVAARLRGRAGGGAEGRVQGWATVHAEGSSHGLHVHAGAAFAGVYYVAAEESAGKLRLYDVRGPRPPFDGVVEVQPREGEVVVFPGWVAHEVEGGEGMRVSLAFNFMGEGGEFEGGRVGLGRWGGEEKEEGKKEGKGKVKGKGNNKKKSKGKSKERGTGKEVGKEGSKKDGAGGDPEEGKEELR